MKRKKKKSKGWKRIWKMTLGILCILAGVAGLVLPLVPGILLILYGGCLLYKNGKR